MGLPDSIPESLNSHGVGGDLGGILLPSGLSKTRLNSVRILIYICKGGAVLLPESTVLLRVKS